MPKACSLLQTLVFLAVLGIAGHLMQAQDALQKTKKPEEQHFWQKKENLLAEKLYLAVLEMEIFTINAQEAGNLEKTQISPNLKLDLQSAGFRLSPQARLVALPGKGSAWALTDDAVILPGAKTGQVLFHILPSPKGTTWSVVVVPCTKKQHLIVGMARFHPAKSIAITQLSREKPLSPHILAMLKKAKESLLETQVKENVPFEFAAHAQLYLHTIDALWAEHCLAQARTKTKGLSPKEVCRIVRTHLEKDSKCVQNEILDPFLKKAQGLDKTIQEIVKSRNEIVAVAKAFYELEEDIDAVIKLIQEVRKEGDDFPQKLTEKVEKLKKDLEYTNQSEKVLQALLATLEQKFAQVESYRKDAERFAAIYKPYHKGISRQVDNFMRKMQRGRLRYPIPMVQELCKIFGYGKEKLVELVLSRYRNRNAREREALRVELNASKPEDLMKNLRPVHIIRAIKEEYGIK